MTINKRKLEDGVNRMKPLTRNVRLAAGDDVAAEVPVGVVDIEARTVTFSFSSETPCPMWYGDEILSHVPGSARMERINSGGSLLFNHDMDDLLGVVEKAWIGADKRGYCTVRFGNDDRGNWAMSQVNDRILQNVSFMYRVHTYLYDVDSDVYTATDWEVYEISLVTVPADASVGVGRSAASEEMDVVVNRPQSTPAPAETQEEIDMRNGIGVRGLTAVLMAAAIEGASGGAAAAIAAPPVDHVAVEHARKTEIEAMCKAHNVPDEVRMSLITLQAPIEMARGIVLNQVLARNNGTASLGGDNNPDMTEKEKGKYSLLRALRAATAERMGDSNAWKESGFEREVSNDIAKRSGKSTAGFFMPTNLRFAMRAADYSFGTGSGLSATSGGSNIVATNLLAGSFIDLLRNKARVLAMGAQMLSGLVGNIDIPRQKAAGQTYWVGEGQVLTQTGAQFDKVSMSPKHIGALSVITRNMMMQSSPDVEMLARADLLSTLALGVDLAALSGSGANGQPLGVANQAGVGSVAGGANGSALTIDDMIDLETFVASSNADEATLAYLTNAKAVGTLKKLKSTTGEYLWSNSPLGQRTGTPGEINGYTVARTNQARSTLTKGAGTNLSEVFFGDWSQIIVGEWGVVEILPNPYAAGIYEAGGIELRILQSLDIAVRHGQSFAIKSDAITS